MPWCTLRRFAPRNSVMYSVASWYIQIIFNPPITASGELVSRWIGPVTSIIIGMDKGMSLDFICFCFETYRYFRLWPLAHFFFLWYGCKRDRGTNGASLAIEPFVCLWVPFINIFSPQFWLYTLLLAHCNACPWRSHSILAQIYMHYFRLQPLAHFPRVLLVQTVTATGEPFAHHSP